MRGMREKGVVRGGREMEKAEGEGGLIGEIDNGVVMGEGWMRGRSGW